MTLFFYIITFLHLFIGMISILYFLPDRKTINNENQMKKLKAKLGICKEEDYVHSQRYLDNIEYEKIFSKAFPKYNNNPNSFYNLTMAHLTIPMLIIIFMIPIKLTKIQCIDNIFNFFTITLTIIFIICYMKFLISIYHPKYIKPYNEIIKVKPLFDISTNIYSYSAAYLTIISIICVLNYNICISRSEQKSIVEESTRTLNGRKYISQLILKSSNCGEFILDVSEDIRKQAKKGDNVKVVIKKGLFGARYIERDSISLIKETNTDNK